MRKSARTGSVLKRATRIATMNPTRGSKPVNLRAIGFVTLLRKSVNRSVAEHLASRYMLSPPQAPRPEIGRNRRVFKGQSEAADLNAWRRILSAMDDNRDKLLAHFETGVWIFLIVVSAAILGLIFWLAYSILL